MIKNEVPYSFKNIYTTVLIATSIAPSCNVLDCQFGVPSFIIV